MTPRTIFTGAVLALVMLAAASTGTGSGTPLHLDTTPINDTDDDWCPDDLDLDGDGIGGELGDDCAPVAVGSGSAGDQFRRGTPTERFDVDDVVIIHADTEERHLNTGATRSGGDGA